MTGYIGNIENITLTNTNYRQVLYTAKNLQLVVMSLKPGEEIGLEVHPDIDQFFRFEKGEGKVLIDDKVITVHKDEVVIVPAGSSHNVINTSKTDSLQLYTLYSPPEHPDGTVQATKADDVHDH